MRCMGDVRSETLFKLVYYTSTHPVIACVIQVFPFPKLASLQVPAERDGSPAVAQVVLRPQGRIAANLRSRISCKKEVGSW
jgi:hypothetical protein